MLLVIFGCNGMLGNRLMKDLGRKHQVIGVSRKEADITDRAALLECVAEIKPQIIINCAAYTNVDGCESEPDLAHRVNSLGPKNLAEVSKQYGAALVHISTDYVFDGKKKSPYKENDPVNPLNLYGKSKLSGEAEVLGITDRCYILRTQWLYGEGGRNFVDVMLESSREKKELSVVADQFGSPTYVKDLSGAIAQIIKTEAYGLYHVTNSGAVSWYEFALEIFRQAGVNNVNIKPCSTEEYPRPATRPRYSALSNDLWSSTGFLPLRDYREALGDYLCKIGRRLL